MEPVLLERAAPIQAPCISEVLYHLHFREARSDEDLHFVTFHEMDTTKQLTSGFMCRIGVLLIRI